MTIKNEIRKLAEEKNALILAHNYQPGEIQDIADVTGDSLELARIAANNKADIIIFCGVHFMAESAAILSPEKKVIIPELSAGCPMADMANADALRKLKSEHPDAIVVTYINSTAAVKAESDVICTSSNAVDIVRKIDSEKIIFVPDKNLGSYVAGFTDKEIILWDGFCPVHNDYTADELEKIKNQYPDATVMVHPECNPDVIRKADKIMSTGQMVKYIKESNEKRIIVGTEKDMIHKLKSVNPDIDYIPASPGFVCHDMKKITLEKLRDSLLKESPVVTVNKDTMEKARRALERMLELS